MKRLSRCTSHLAAKSGDVLTVSAAGHSAAAGGAAWVSGHEKNYRKLERRTALTLRSLAQFIR
jgi:hypothetical protein